jgi:hypothetical protein
MHVFSEECDETHNCCDNPANKPTRAEEESVRRALTKLAEERAVC